MTLMRKIKVMYQQRSVLQRINRFIIIQYKLNKEFIQYKQHQEKQKLISDIMKIEKQRKNIKAQYKPTKPRVKTFDEYFQECIKNRTIPPDTPPYFRKALERALREYQQGIIKEKSALEEFANKYIIKGEPGVTPFQYFKDEAPQPKDFLRNHRNIKVRFILVCVMAKMEVISDKPLYIQTKAYFHSKTHINLEATDVKKNTCCNDKRDS